MKMYSVHMPLIMKPVFYCARGRGADDQRLNFQRGVQAAAQGEQLGELFQYEVKEPVSLPRHRSALLPVITADFRCEKFSIYDQSVHSQHPLYGVRLKNTSEMYFMEGPATVFEDGRYAGDALLEGIGPGDERLISYGIDLEVEVSPELEGQTRSLVQARIVSGTLHATYERIRENMEQIDRNSDLYSRYLEKLSNQEDDVEALQQKIDRLEKDLQAAQRELNQYIAGLELIP